MSSPVRCSDELIRTFVRPFATPFSLNETDVVSFATSTGST